MGLPLTTKEMHAYALSSTLLDARVDYALPWHEQCVREILAFIIFCMRCQVLVED